MAMQADMRYARGMNRVISFAVRTAIGAALLSAAAGPAIGQGPIGTMKRGPYVCELPGDAAGSAGIEQSQANFTITTASRYTSAQGDGTYLRRGETLSFTSGPRAGETYRVISDGFLRFVENGKPGRLRCVHRAG